MKTPWSLPLVTICLLCLTPARFSGAAPLGLRLSLEVGADELQSSEERELYLRPEAGYALGDTGLRAGLGWELPMLSEAGPGSLEAWQEFEAILPGVVLLAGNNNVVQLDELELEGRLYVVAGLGLGDFLLELETDLAYAPAFRLSAIPAVIFEKDLGPGTLEIGIRQELLLAPRSQLGDTEFPLGYELPVGAFWIGVELEAALSEGFRLSALVQAGRHF